MAPTGLAIILGAGPTTASGIARVFARSGLAVALLSRSITPDSPLVTSLRATAGPSAILHPFATDTSHASLSRCSTTSRPTRTCRASRSS
jgi:hypothetical protein